MGPNRSEVRIACVCHVLVCVSSPYPKFGPKHQIEAILHTVGRVWGALCEGLRALCEGYFGFLANLLDA